MIKVKKKWTNTKVVQSPESKSIVVSASIGFNRYKFIKTNGINVSVLMRDTIDQLMEADKNNEDIFKRYKNTKCFDD